MSLKYSVTTKNYMCKNNRLYGTSSRSSRINGGGKGGGGDCEEAVSDQVNDGGNQLPDCFNLLRCVVKYSHGIADIVKIFPVINGVHLQHEERASSLSHTPSQPFLPPSIPLPLSLPPLSSPSLPPSLCGSPLV